ncbi:MAG: 2'-5' RNA ligase family protein [Candidatus Cyclobacteriaceae bacterium M3_2C_046]
MYYALAYFPALNHDGLNQIRELYDPTYPQIEEHIAVIFPVPGEVGLQPLRDHIVQTLSRHKPFPIVIKDLTLSWDNWLFLLLQEGRQTFIKLHDELYQGILSGFLRKDIPFQPHLALGLMTSASYDHKNPKSVQLDTIKYEKAFQEAQGMDLEFKKFVDQLTLLQLNDTFDQIKKLEVFYLRN